ncbi:hypothetical protein [Nocardia nepalensis]|uniref:hypothetical protein n=1 Tax=Nocardia nepalensis TaxID=3375448 RepID=UPI003B680BA0
MDHIVAGRAENSGESSERRRVQLTLVCRWLLGAIEQQRDLLRVVETRWRSVPGAA